MLIRPMKGHMMEWRNQVAVVTGGARGLGRATAGLLAQRGAAVCVNYAVHADAAEAVVAEIATAGRTSYRGGGRRRRAVRGRGDGHPH
jgi:NAD(P)-dependent dehydrogenase (short-subunit alcohol dehydrogenase family)